MPVEVIGIDHVFVAVRDMEAAKGFYDRVMPILGFRRGDGSLAGGTRTSSTTAASSSTR
jgi:catechol 2,3-dioxygenase-like lactoylglutathione lyase family enzyme